MNTAKLDQLFADYEESFAQLDFKNIAMHYSDNFIGAGPKGSLVNNKKEFMERVREASAFYESIGQHSGRIISIEVLHISNEYCMVTVHWAVKYHKTGDQEISFDVSYIVQEINDEMKIILFISHEGEQELIKSLGLLTAPAN